MLEELTPRSRDTRRGPIHNKIVGRDGKSLPSDLDRIVHKKHPEIRERYALAGRNSLRIVICALREYGNRRRGKRFKIRIAVIQSPRGSGLIIDITRARRALIENIARRFGGRGVLCHAQIESLAERRVRLPRRRAEIQGLWWIVRIILAARLRRARRRRSVQWSAGVGDCPEGIGILRKIFVLADPDIRCAVRDAAGAPRKRRRNPLPQRPFVLIFRRAEYIDERRSGRQVLPADAERRFVLQVQINLGVSRRSSIFCRRRGRRWRGYRFRALVYVIADSQKDQDDDGGKNIF